MNSTKLIILFLFLSGSIFAQETALFRIVENGKIGFINNKGEKIIEPTYLEAGEFSEGLASFRIGGQYGFINSLGEVVIPAKYDFVGDFQNGIVDVYVDGEVLFVNKKGDRALPKRFESIQFIDEHLCVFTTKQEKSGLYDLKTASVVMKAKKMKIGAFSDGLAVVTRKGSSYRPDVGVIDRKGNFVVDFGTFSQINKFVDGYALVEIKNPIDENKTIDGLIDSKGKLLFERPKENHSYIEGGFYEGFAKVNLYNSKLSESDDMSWSSDKAYEGFINRSGKLVFKDVSIKSVRNFSNGRAFIEDTNRGHYVVDTDFNVLNKEPFQEVKGNGFVDGHAIVRTKKGWGIIDVNLNFIVQPEHLDIYEGGIVDGKYLYAESGPNHSRLYGLKDLKGNVIVAPILNDFSTGTYKDGLIQSIVDGRLTFLNEKGDVVWQEKKEDDTSNEEMINITHLNRGYFYVQSNPKKVGRSLKEELVLEEKNNKLFIKNYLNEAIQFDAQDGRLYLKLQAKDKKGQWKDIEYLPGSWCGNSYYAVELPAKKYWEFDLPKYTGEFETALRAELSYLDPVTNKTALIYSNEFKGSVNPGQFWRKPEYSVRGLMDPYVE